MHIQQIHGRWGEQLAAEFLKRQGMTVLATNWRYKRAEIDVIARDEEILVFIEVKLRSYTEFGQPEEMVTRRKQRLLIDAALAYMRETGYDWEIRFDIVAILAVPDKEPVVRLLKDAFFPGLGYRG